MRDNFDYWQLFIDESGDLTTNDRRSVVCGLALRERDTPESRKILREKVQSSLGFAPYPPHATLLNYPAGWIAAWRLHKGEIPERFAGWADICKAGFRRISEDRSKPSFEHFSSQLDQGSFPSFDAIQAVSKRLTVIDEALCKKLRTVVNEADLAMRELFRNSKEIFGSQNFYILLASPSRRKETMPNDDDRYRGLLEALLERAAELLRPPEGLSRIVDIQAAQRFINSENLNRYMLTQPELGRIATKVMNGYREPPSRFSLNPPFKFRVAGVPDANRDPNVHPGVVLADWIANRVGRVTAGMPNLERLYERIEAKTELSVKRSASWKENEGLPAAAADGPGRDIVVQAYRGGEIATAMDITPLWTQEQAKIWIAAAEAIKGGAK